MFSDWTISDRIQTNVSWADSYAGNVTLANALPTVAGPAARRLDATFGSGFCAGNRFLSIKPTAVGGAFNAIPVSKMLSQRAYLRASGASLGIMAKCGGGNGEGNRIPGYRLTLGNLLGPNTTAAFALRLVAHSAGADTLISTTCDGTYAPDLWYRCRFDVTAQGGGASDLLEAFTGVGDPDAETWTKVGELSIPNSSAYYSAWGGSADIASTGSSGRAGVLGLQASAMNGGGGGSASGFVDVYKAIVTPL